VVEGLEPTLLKELAVFVRTQPDLLLRLQRLPVLLRLQRNRIGKSCSGLESEIAIGFCSGAGMMEPGMGRDFDMDTGLDIGLDTGMGMFELLW
jgi:hypothetical protein